jgi:uncharacterized protein (TIGR03083 family)
MDDVLADRCTILAGVWQWWAETLRTIDESDWLRPTRLEAWNVAALVGHHSLLVQGLGYLSSQPVDDAAVTTSAADMLRQFNEPGGLATRASGVVAEMARQQAASQSPAALTAVFAQTAPRVVDSIRAAGPIVVEYFGNGTFPLAETVSIAILEAVVHGLDLSAALDIENASLPSDATRETVALLASMADPLPFIEAATGRQAGPVLPVLR